MTRRSLAAHLIDFSASPTRDVSVPLDADRNARTDDDAAAVARAYAEGVRDGRAAGQEEADIACDARIADAERSFEARLAQSREDWVREGAAFGTRIDAAIGAAGDEIAASVARVLVEIATLTRRPIATEAIAAQIRQRLREGNIQRLHLAGPADLLDALWCRLDDHTIATRETADVPDLRVQIDATVLETTLDAWRVALLDSLEIAA